MNAEAKTIAEPIARPAPKRIDLSSKAWLFAVRVGFIVLLIAVWHGVVITGWMPDYLFPSPWAVVQSLASLASDGTLAASIAASLGRMAAGYSISVVGGLAIGLLAARIALFKETFGSLVLSLQSLPSVCWLPLALIWVGLNERAVLAVVILGAIFAIAVATESAIRNIPPIYGRVGHVLGARGFTFSRDILFFAALPELISGLKLGWTFAWRSLMAAELIRQDVMGVGRLLETGRQFNDTAMMLASMVTILAIGLLVDRLLFGTIENKIRIRYGLQRA